VRRVLVIGPCGAGKSTLARELATHLDLPLHHMDRLNWKSGWVETDEAELRAKQRALVADEAWLIEGTYGGTLDERLPRADTIVYLDFPIPLCVWRVVKRVLTLRGLTRPDMTEDCPERLDLIFLWYVASWNSGPRKRLERKLAPHADKVVRLRSPREAEAWLDRLLTSRPLADGGAYVS
jgi:adenylate kinase family enzyme